MNPYDVAQSHRPLYITALSCLIILGIGCLRFFLEANLSVQILYLIPIFWVSWVAGWKMGFLLSIGASFAEFLGFTLGKNAGISPPLLYWNVGSSLFLFLGAAYLTGSFQAIKQKNKEISQIDPLTGVPNGNCFFDRADMEIKRARRYPRPFTVAYLDIDHFRRVNEHFGHSIGDALLKTLADLLKTQLRATDTPARLGGDEFAILLPETGFEASQFAIRRIQKVLTDAMHKNGWEITFTLGIVTFLHPPSHVDAMLNRVEHVMHSAKHSSKNHLRHELYEKPSILSSL